MKKMNPWKSILVLACIFFVVGCGDADPFEFNRRDITAGYYLEGLDGGDAFLLMRRSHEGTPQGYIPGPILELGWDSSVLAVKRQYPYLKDEKRLLPDAWIVIDLKNHSQSDPIEESKFRRRHPSLKTQDINTVWSSRL